MQHTYTSPRMYFYTRFDLVTVVNVHDYGLLEYYAVQYAEQVAIYQTTL
jgi:hypothetical protein